MPRPCTICRHERRREIDKALLTSENTSETARTFGVQRKAVERHAKAHMRAVREQARAFNDQISALDLLSEFLKLKATTEGILDRALGSKNVREQIAASREVRETLVALGKLIGAFEVGPKHVIEHHTRVLQIVSQLSTEELRAAIAAQEPKALTP